MSITKHFHDIENAISSLVDFVRSSEVSFAEAYTLPSISKTEEHDHISEIEVKSHKMCEAVDSLLNGLSDFWIYNANLTDSSKSVRRYPGLIVINGDSELHAELNDLIRKVNHHKCALKNLRVSKYTKRSVRYEAMHSALPGAITEQVDRMVPLSDIELYSVSYSWVRKTSTVKVDGEKLIESLRGQLNKPQSCMQIDEWNEMLVRESNLISMHMDGDRLRQRRNVKVHPIYNALTVKEYDDQERNKRKRQLKASLPLIIVQSDLPRYTALKDYREDEQRRGYIKSSLSCDPLIPRLNLYHKK
ncbi:hypothetical protein I3271_04475 [Photobacterium leiognathi]|uniref:DNA replication terminus site-binding protein n=1 Tax=Photobacterium leiognathi TaxID=553611 RepID=UPI001EDF906F|nr:DNA replication terminus site-binding protein [Photobacterium leiognathi]MCG3883939.1 hypothetical protein [Photobacterium leiognathi]